MVRYLHRTRKKEKELYLKGYKNLGKISLHQLLLDRKKKRSPRRKNQDNNPGKDHNPERKRISKEERPNKLCPTCTMTSSQEIRGVKRDTIIIKFKMKEKLRKE